MFTDTNDMVQLGCDIRQPLCAQYCADSEAFQDSYDFITVKRI